MEITNKMSKKFHSNNFTITQTDELFCNQLYNLTWNQNLLNHQIKLYDESLTRPLQFQITNSK